MAYRPSGLTTSRVAPTNGPRLFSRFLELPPELRNEIYKLYLGDKELVLGRYNQQPALTRVSGQIRQETLPLFENQSVFAANMLVWPHDSQITVRAQDLLTDMAQKRLSSSRYLKFTITLNAAPRRRFCITIDLSQPGDKNRAIMIKSPRHARKDDDFYRNGVETALHMMIYCTAPQRDGWLGCLDVMHRIEEKMDLVFRGKGEWLRIARIFRRIQ